MATGFREGAGGGEAGHAGSDYEDVGGSWRHILLDALELPA